MQLGNYRSFLLTFYLERAVAAGLNRIIALGTTGDRRSKTCSCVSDLSRSTMTTFPTPKRPEVTPGDAFRLGLPFVLDNQSIFNYWNIRTGDYFVEMEGEHYGWDNATIQVAEAGPGFGPPVHTHPVEEIFVLVD